MEELEERDLRAARNVADFCMVGQGDNVLILKDHNTHPVVERAVEIAVEERGGHVTIFEVRHPQPTYGFRHRTVFPKEYRSLHEAYKGADVAIQLGTGLFYAGLDEIRFTYGLTYCLCDAKSLEIFRSEYFLFPYQLVARIGEKFYNKLKGGKRRVHLTSLSGTDYSCFTDVDRFGVSGGMSHPLCAKLRCPGDWSFFPSGNLGLCEIPDEPSNGVFVADFLPAFTCPGAMKDSFLRAAKEPTRIIIKDHWVSNIEGAYADEILELWELTGDKYVRYDGGPMLGLNPKACPMSLESQDQRVWYQIIHSSPMMYHQHIGVKWGLSGGRSSAFTFTPYCYRPTLEIDGMVLIKDGELTEEIIDDELRREAAKYGDPDKMLRIVTAPYDEVFNFRYGKK